MHGSPHWSPSRDRIVFGLYKNGIADLYQKRQPTLSSPEELLVTSAYSKAPMQLSNGFLVYQEFNPKTKRDIWFLTVDASAAAIPQTSLQPPSDELYP